MQLALVICAAAAVGYVAGRARPGQRLFSWAEARDAGPHGLAWWVAQGIGWVAVAWMLTAHPLRSAANRRSWREARATAARRASAPAFDPNWAANRTTTSTTKEDESS